jgi:diguanylate cyclase (GGDEF)-like protein/PAS domain S-box-containing protein
VTPAPQRTTIDSGFRRAVTITAVYAILAALWIYSSDALLGLLIADASLFTLASTYKGWVFVAVTSLLLYSVLRAAPALPADRGAAVPLRIWPPLLIFALFIGAVGGTGLLVYRSIERGARARAEETLAAVANLKAQQVGDWLVERRDNADRASHSPFMAPETEAWLARGAPPDQTAARLRSLLEGLRASQQWDSVYLVDREGAVRLDVHGGATHQGIERTLAMDAMRSRRVLMRDLHHHEGGELALGFYAPLLVGDERGERAVAAIVMELDPRAHLFPLVANWPLASRSGESILLRADGDSVLYLSALRHRPGSALAFRLPASTEDFVAARALRGDRDRIEGTDYRGTPVLASARPIGGAPWLVVAKMDMAEVEGPIAESARPLGVFGMVLVLAAGLTTAFWLRQERASALIRQLRAERERTALATQLDHLTRHANDIILLIDAGGRILDANERAIAAYGRAREELIGANAASLRSAAQMETFRSDWERAQHEDGIVFETVHQRADGSTFPVEVSSRAIRVDGSVLRQSIIRDISERKESEERASLWANVLENSAEGIIVTDASRKILDVNKAFTDVTGYAPHEAIGQDPSFLKSGRHDDAFYHVMWRSIRESGRWQGEIWNRRRNGEIYPGWLSITAARNAAGTLTHYVGVFSDITERKESAERIHFLVTHDSLTGLPNRSVINDLIVQALAVARRKTAALALLFLDLDRFKTINDSLGHPAGDTLLQRVAARLAAGIRDEDKVARLGGDEFLILLPELARGEDAGIVADKVLAALREPLDVDGRALRISASIGISIYPDDGSDAATLIKNADAAMYHAKERGRNNYQFFTADMNTRAFEALAMDMSLRGAVQRDEFRLEYQPLIDGGSGTIVAAEALIRWHHPELGLIPPSGFIPIAEERGLIVPIGEWVLREACSQVRRWLDAGVAAVAVGVNVSAVQFRQPGFAASVRTILSECGIEPRYLQLEVTESIIMRDAEQTIAVLEELSAMGVSLSIDDFGTGYSSLSYLRRFPIDRLKIDRSFVHDITTSADAAAIASAIIGMGRTMNLRVVAEGVETAAQLAFLVGERCDELQGYHIARPMEAARLSALLAAAKPLVELGTLAD